MGTSDRERRVKNGQLEPPKKCSERFHFSNVSRTTIKAVLVHPFSFALSLSSNFSSTVDVIMEFAQDHMYPPNELASPPLAQPLRKPSVVGSLQECDDDYEPFARSTSGLSGRTVTSIRRKHESYNLSGSIFLVTSSGATLNLPVPSKSSADPLNWSNWTTAGAIAAIAWYSIVSLTVVQAASMVYHLILVEFDGQVGFPI